MCSSTRYLVAKQENIVIGYPPSILYLDSLLEDIRNSNYMEIERNQRNQYSYFDAKLSKTELFSDDEIVPMLTMELRKNKRDRPSLRGFWHRFVKDEEMSRLYGDFGLEG